MEVYENGKWGKIYCLDFMKQGDIFREFEGWDYRYYKVTKDAYEDEKGSTFVENEEIEKPIFTQD